MEALGDSTVENPLILNWNGHEYHVNKPLDQSGHYVDLHVVKKIIEQHNELVEALTDLR